MSTQQYETDYEVGQDNIEMLGMDIHNPVFFVSALLILAFVVGTMIFPETSSAWLGGAKSWTLANFDWFFTIAINFVFVFCLVLAISPIGRIRLGGQQATPDFSYISWITMLFSAGIGIGLMFWGSAEPLAYYTGWSGTPFNVEANTPEAQRLAMSATLFHWGFSPWAVYAIIGLALAFFSYNKGLPLTIRSALYPILGDRIWGWPGHIIDFFAVVSTLFGLATSLGFGAQQAAGGLNFLFGISDGMTTQFGIIVGITGLAILSVIRGMDGGIKLLSNINMSFAAVLLLFVLITGPTLLIISGIGINTVNYVMDFVPLSNWIGREDINWYHGWTIFYWAWWVSWAPFVGMFIARVSKGRTIREFVLAVMFVPVVVSILWFTTFGNTAIDQLQQGAGQLAGGFGDNSSMILFYLLENLPWTEVTVAFSIILILIFFVTSADSGSLVLDTITAGGKVDAPVPQRIFWACMIGAVAAILLFGGGDSVLGSLQAGTITAALPFTFVMLVCCLSLYKGLREEYRGLQEVKQ